MVPAVVGPPLPNEADVVVIGAGIGGLMSAALLAKAGLKVCVLEMDTRPGGYLAGYERKGFIFDTAIHWLNQCGDGGVVRRLFDTVGPGAPHCPPLHSIRRYRGESFDYTLTDDPDDMLRKVSNDYPDQAAGLHKFFENSKKIGVAFEEMSRGARAKETMSGLELARYGISLTRVGLTFARYWGTETEKGIDKHYQAPILKRIYCSEQYLLSCLTPVGWAYQGDYQAPPPGGSREMPRFLVRAIRSWGGGVFYKARVDKIVLDGKGRATAVEVTVGRRDPVKHVVTCDWVLAACDLETVYEKMLPEETVDQGLKDRLRKAELYDSNLVVSLGLDVPTATLGFSEELVMITRDDVSRVDHNAGDPEKTAITVLPPSLRDPTLAPEGKGTLTLSVTANIGYGERWKTGPGDERGESYRAFKQAYADVLIDRAAKVLCPDLREHIELCEVATPITHARYTGNRDGSLMGGRPTRTNIRNKIAHYRTAVPNMLLAGQWAEYGGGVPVAVRAGANAAMLVMQKERPEAFKIVRDVFDAKRAPDDLDPKLLKPLEPVV
jgi:prolycopene isomerase